MTDSPGVLFQRLLDVMKQLREPGGCAVFRSTPAPSAADTPALRPEASVQRLRPPREPPGRLSPATPT